VTPASELRYRPDIDGLRAIAVATVVAFHAGVPGFGGGFIGVDIFFVISGYLITGIIARESAKGEFRLSAFYARRARRILPALGLVLAAVLVAGYAKSAPIAYEKIGGNVAAGAAFISNFWLWKTTSYFGAASGENPLLHLWSLGVEEQYYFVWPLLLMAFLRFGNVVRTTTLLALGSLAASHYLSTTDLSAAFYSPLSRAWELLLGSCLAMLPSETMARAGARGRDVLSGAGLAMVLIGLAWIRKGTSFPGLPALLPTLGAAFLIAAGPAALVNRALLSMRPMAWVGLISYPLYLWHWPSLVFGRQVYGPTPTVEAGAVAIALFLSIVTYRVVERPIRRGTGGRFVAPLLALQGALAALALVVIDGHGFSSRFDAKRLRLFQYAADARAIGDTTEAQCLLAPAETPERLPPPCGAAPATGAKVVLLWGDSYADHLGHGLRHIAPPGSAVAQLTASLCPPIFGYKTADRPNCENVNAFAHDWIARHRPASVVIAARWVEYRLGELGATLAELRSLGVRDIVLVGSPAQFSESVPIALARDVDQGVPERLTSPVLQDLLSADALVSQVTRRAGGQFASLLAVQCNGDRCLAALGGSVDSLLVRDEAHLTFLGSRFLAERALGPAIRSLR
jgi:peptidoglycan/LPS O-acetylase OafA/YrhL